MGLISNMFNYSKPGPGIEKEEQQKRRFFLFFVYCRPLPDLTLSNSSAICASGSAVQRETMTITRTLKMNAGSSS